MDERKIPKTLEEAYTLRDGSESVEAREFYQDHIYRLRREEYRARGIRTEISSRRRERQSAIEFSREMFFLEVGEIVTARRNPGENPDGEALAEARGFATRIDNHAFLKQLASPHSNAVDLYRRNYLELLRLGKEPSEAYYISRVIGLAGEREFRQSLERVRQTGYPKGGGLSYLIERSAVQVRDFPGGMVLILLTFFASLFLFVWASGEWQAQSLERAILIGIGLLGTGTLMIVCAIFIFAFIRSMNK